MRRRRKERGSETLLHSFTSREVPVVSTLTSLFKCVVVLILQLEWKREKQDIILTHSFDETGIEEKRKGWERDTITKEYLLLHSFHLSLSLLHPPCVYEWEESITEYYTLSSKAKRELTKKKCTTSESWARNYAPSFRSSFSSSDMNNTYCYSAFLTLFTKKEPVLFSKNSISPPVASFSFYSALLPSVSITSSLLPLTYSLAKSSSWLSPLTWILVFFFFFFPDEHPCLISFCRSRLSCRLDDTTKTILDKSQDGGERERWNETGNDTDSRQKQQEWTSAQQQQDQRHTSPKIHRTRVEDLDREVWVGVHEFWFIIILDSSRDNSFLKAFYSFLVLMLLTKISSFFEQQWNRSVTNGSSLSLSLSHSLGRS